MAVRKDLTGQKFGRLTVIGHSHRNPANRVNYWRARCDCGVEKVFPGNNLCSGNSNSCGCVHGVPISDPIRYEELVRLVNYDPSTGKFTWLVDAKAHAKGSEAGYTHAANPYVRIMFRKRSYYAHVLAWLYMTGEWPEGEIDHRDVDHANNKWGNLRLADRFQNSHNTKIQKRNKLGYKGVHAEGSRFLARIVYKRQFFSLGSYDTAEAAARAYDAAAVEKFGAFARTNFEHQ